MEEERVEVFPVRTLHDLADRMAHEWNIIRTAAITGLASSVFLTVFIVRFVFRYLPRLVQRAYLDAVLLVIAFPCMLFVLFASIEQYRFYSEWKKRFQRLKQLEDELMGRYR